MHTMHIKRIFDDLSMDMLFRFCKYKIIFLISIPFIFCSIIRQSIHFLYPKSSPFNNSLYRIHTMLHNYQEDKIPISHRNLIIFYIGDLSISSNE